MDWILSVLGSGFQFITGRGYSGDDSSASAGSLHSGIDFRAAKGTPVPALVSGTVVYAANEGPDAAQYHAVSGGNVVNIRDASGQTQYAHLDSIAVRVGDFVTKGQVLGTVGNTGATSTGPHLHIGREEGGKWIDPLKSALPTLMNGPQTNPGGSAATRYVELFARVLQQPLDYVLTQPDIDRVVEYLVAVNPPSPFNDYKTPDDSRTYYHGVFDKFLGKPISAIGSSVQDLPSFPDAVGSGLGFNFDISGALMFVGIILVGVVLIATGGLFALRNRESG